MVVTFLNVFVVTVLSFFALFTSRGEIFGMRLCDFIEVRLMKQPHGGYLVGFGALLCFWGYACTLAHAQENPLFYRPVNQETASSVQQADQNILVQMVQLPLSFYAKVLSRLDGDRCPSSPNCALYARQAMDRHGAVWGLWMTVDRLIHERTEIVRGAQQGRVVRVQDGSKRVLDTLEANDFWLRDE